MHLSDKLAAQLAEQIRNLMHHWHPNSQAADYCCEFCGNTADTNQGEVTHQKECVGVELLAELEHGLQDTSTAACLMEITRHVMES